MMILTLCTMLPTLVIMDSWKTQMMSIQIQEKAQTRGRYFSREGLYWSRTPPNVARARRQNIIVRLPGCVDEAKSANTTRDAFSLFISDNILNIILTHTYQKN